MAETTVYGSSGDIVWQNWTFGTSASGNDGVWSAWANDSNATTADFSNDAVWQSWTSVGSGTVTLSHRTYHPPSPPPETEEQRQARLDREQRFKIEREAARLEKEAAQRRAEELLRESLDQEQLEQFSQTKWFFVIGQSGRQYRVRHGWVGNIDELNKDGAVVANWCIHPSVRVPVEDSMLIQKLMLEADEKRLWLIANKTERRPAESLWPDSIAA